MVHALGLALSGGGSRAAAFHCGTVRALERLGLLSAVDVVSSVSGGSVFAAGWAASIVSGETTSRFLERMTEELGKGFILRALLEFPSVVGLLPWYPRTQMLAKVFSSLTRDLKLGELPERPLFCLNTTVLNSGQVGKFARDGFSTPGLGRRDASGSNPTIPCVSYPLALAAAASAAFPVGLPPVLLRKKDWFPSTETVAPLKGHRTLALTDGGVLENLGTQTLFKSERFATRDIISSDAGTRDVPWRPSNPLYWLRSFGIWLASGSILERFTLVMNDKQNRWMRQELFDAATAHEKPPQRRNVILVRIATDWDQLVGSVRRQRLEELAPGAVPPGPIDARAVQALLAKHDSPRAALLQEARESYERLTISPSKLNRMGTNFTGLPENTLAALAEHAYWQVLAAYALYWDPQKSVSGHQKG